MLGWFKKRAAKSLGDASKGGDRPMLGWLPRFEKPKAYDTKLELAKTVIRETSTGFGAFGIVVSSDVFPPRAILNDFLLQGSDACDQDGFSRWTPFELSSHDYDALRAWWLETHPKAIEDSLGATSWSDWFVELDSFDEP